jgi:RNA polymerase sigma-70 factor (ECF subfamily)
MVAWGQLVREAMERALRAWPELTPSLDDFEAHVRRLSIDAEALEVRGDELYLAYACSRGQTAALRILERHYVEAATRAVARVNAARDFIDEVHQTLNEHLLVGSEPKIAQFAATGPLGAWLRVAAVRTALNLEKARRNRDELLAEELIESATHDTAENKLYRDAAQAALQSAFAVLSPRERNVLRLCYIEARTIDQIGALYAAHRATAARWLAAARQRIFDQVSEELRARFRLSASEVQSVLVRVRSQLEVSVLRLLGPEREQEPVLEGS